MDVFSHKMKQTESLHMEEFFNVKEPFYVLFFTSTNHISYYKRGNILIPVDYYHNYIPTITNQNWSLSTHKLFPENIRKQIKEFVLIQFKFYRSKIPKDILFHILNLVFDYENIIYDPEFVDDYNFVKQKDTQVLPASCENMKNQEFVDHLNLFI